MRQLSGKTALITGASVGLGAQFARCLSAAGARVIVAARRLDKLEALAETLGNARALKMDVSDTASILTALNQLEADNEKIDILINNAGILKNTSIFNPDEHNDFESIIKTNISGVWHVTKAVARHMKRHDIAGSIINIGSISGKTTPGKFAAAYNASKAAVMHLTKALVGELSPHHIRINAISPGFFITDMTTNIAPNPNWADDVVKSVPLGFMPNHDDLNGALLFLASNDASRFVTGSIVSVDGGVSWRG